MVQMFEYERIGGYDNVITTKAWNILLVFFLNKNTKILHEHDHLPFDNLNNEVRNHLAHQNSGFSFPPQIGGIWGGKN